MMKTVIISDVHGCSGALRTLLAKIFPDPKEDRLIMLGDLFDRGPDSWGVFRMVKELADAYGDRFVLLRGNHEDYLMQPKLTFQQRLVWERVGRGATARSFKQHGEKMEDTLPWLKDHVVFYYRGESGGPSSSEGGDAGDGGDALDLAFYEAFWTLSGGLDAGEERTVFIPLENAVSMCMDNTICVNGTVAAILKTARIYGV